MNKPLISVVVPVYKVEEYLDYCVQSIVNQTYKNLEIILVDDGSPDNCPKMCDEWQKKDSRIKVIHKKNGGVSSARNNAIDIATGEYIHFVDSDDYLNINTIEILYNVIIENNADLSMCSWKKVYDTTKPDNMKYNMREAKIKNFDGDDVFGLLFNKKVPLIMVTWAKLYKSSIFDNIKYPEDLHVCEDEYAMLYVLNKVSKLSFVDLPLYNNLQRENSLTSQKYSIKHVNGLRAFKDRWDFCINNRQIYEQEALRKYLISMAIVYTKYKKSDGRKDVLIKIEEEYNACYKLLKKKPISIVIFRYCKWLFKLMLEIKERV